MAKRDTLKLSEANTIRLLQLYKTQPCLYDVNDDNYRNRRLRAAALNGIAAALSVDGFGPEEAAVKFKNLRNSYSQELKKIKDSEASSGGGEDLYVPKVYWFSVMDSFMRPHLYSRHLLNNAGVKQKSVPKKTFSVRRNEDGDEDEDEDAAAMLEDQTTSSLRRADEHETMPFIKRECIEIEQEDAEDSFSAGTSQGIVDEENYAIPAVSEKRGQKRKRDASSEKSSTSVQQSDSSTAVDRLYEISRLAVSKVSNKRDVYSHFGDYIASVLRQTGGQKAVLMQRDICNVVFTHLSDFSARPSIVTHVSSSESSGNESCQEDPLHDSEQIGSHLR